MKSTGVFNTVGSLLGSINSTINGTSEIASSYMDEWRRGRKITVVINTQQRQKELAKVLGVTNRTEMEAKMNELKEFNDWLDKM